MGEPIGPPPDRSCQGKNGIGTVRVHGIRIKLLEHPKISHYVLYRIFYYDAAPFSGKIMNPISGASKNYGTTEVSRQMTQFLDKIEIMENFALRKGVLPMQGWKLARRAEKKLSAKTTLSETDIEPNFS